MLELCIRCPVCGKYHYYSLGDDDVHNIGDIVGLDYEYYSQSYNEKCRSCKNEFLIVELVHRGQLVNVLTNQNKILIELIFVSEKSPTSISRG